ncbi:hypothetical protein MPC38_06620 [Prescottella equi]|uniref:hypothetical protein n=1 Tax=Rhodococcus hoagii TaxID=43767 RepID=UPI001F5BAC2F|nr:hypothetical protein [Prescottella equi]UNQ40918.1 hypothetical protein MPC38_06620 [Prescottella equi]
MKRTITNALWYVGMIAAAGVLGTVVFAAAIAIGLCIGCSGVYYWTVFVAH